MGIIKKSSAMRKSFISSIIAVAAMLTVSSCQVAEDYAVVNAAKGEKVSFQAAATIDAGTRVSYTLNTEENAIYQAWEEGDVITFVDNTRHVSKFKVRSINTEGVADLIVPSCYDEDPDNDYTPYVYSESGIKVRTADTLYAIYYPAGSFSGSMPTYEGNDQNWQYRCSFDLTQGLTGTLEPDTTGKKLRVPLLATAKIESLSKTEFKVDLKFAPLASIVAVKGFTTVADAKITKLTFSGFSTKGSFTYYTGYNSKTYAQSNQYTEFITNGKDEIVFNFDEPLVCDATGKCDVTLYFPVLPAESAEITMTATAEDGAIYSDKFTKKVEAGQYYYTTRTLKALTAGVAQVDGKDYFTFDDALDAVNADTANCELKLLEDVTLTAVKTIKYQGGRKVTLNLNNHKISGEVANPSGSVYQGMLVVQSNIDFVAGGENGGVINTGGRAVAVCGESVKAPLTITFDGGTYSAGASYALVVAGNGNTDNIANVTIKSGKFITASAHAAVQAGGYLKANSAKFVIEDGEFVSPQSAAFRLNGTGAEAVINGGKFTGKNALYTAQTSNILTVNGGTFESTDMLITIGNLLKMTLNNGYFKYPVASMLSNTAKGTIEIKGGYYSDASGLATAADEAGFVTVPAGFKYVESDNADYGYKVVAE